MRKQKYFHTPEFPKVGPMERVFLGMLLGVTQKKFLWSNKSGKHGAN